VKSFELHRIKDAVARKAAFAACEPKIWWETGLFPTLVITDAEVAAEAMRRTDFIIPDHRALVDDIKRRYQRPFEYLSKTMDILPVFLEGERHAAIRKLLGQFLSTKLRELEPRLPGIVRGHLDSLPRTGNVDLVSQLLVPFTAEVFSELAEREVTDQVMEMTLGRIFEATQTVSSLSRLDNWFERLFSFLDAGTPGDERFICQLCCLVFGVDNVLSTLAENMVAAFQQADGANPARLPAYPVETMVSVTHRKAIAPTTIAGHPVQASDLIRIHIEPFGYSADKSANAALFGAGRHACVGKQISLSIWRHLSEQFNDRKIRGQITDYQSECTHTFNFVKTLKVSILP
jgi:cytochrome P450